MDVAKGVKSEVGGAEKLSAATEWQKKWEKRSDYKYTNHRVYCRAWRHKT